MPDNVPISTLLDIVAGRSGIASGSLADASEVATWMADVESRIVAIFASHSVFKSSIAAIYAVSPAAFCVRKNITTLYKWRPV